MIRFMMNASGEGAQARAITARGQPLAYPFWLVVLSYWLPGQLADHAGERTA